MPAWRRGATERIARCGVFDLDRIEFAPPEGGSALPFHVLSAPDWVNVIPLTADGRVVLVRQFRFGIEAETLEIPGGMCDPGESPEAAAQRELREETGYEAGSLEPIGWVHPNPPLQTNRCHSFVARGLTRSAPSPDPCERISVVEVEAHEIPALIRDGRITHALVLAAFHLLGVRSKGQVSRPDP
jgi:8-oxo-dGTP pyrophosphatase MutT (NUDIX family)